MLTTNIMAKKHKHNVNRQSFLLGKSQSRNFQKFENDETINKLLNNHFDIWYLREHYILDDVGKCFWIPYDSN
ncbi:hypothetical protein DERP_012810 [Dermatophagoides pteronyssinus]|uniref:Uncharacterized protein n=1 Tax=Dermatophagoides pteronyssinus TaxID=6956 RepID=A0ABQ8JF57_DERPT|nr:hypothetical protein DERP_012810 [Dermatophagoides pteronyssinus]